MFLYLNGIPKLQITLLPSEPIIDINIKELIHFLQGCQGYTNLAATINLIQQYEASCPNLQLKLPWPGSLPSAEIKVTSNIGTNVILVFAWDLAYELLHSLSTAVANVSN
jgi:hypothetical protein